jgi:hypothetical protein
VTPGSGEFTFTSALVSELRRLANIGRTFSVVDLHQSILAHLAQKNALHNAASYSGWGNTPAPTLQADPTYVRLHGTTQRPSITLRAFQSMSEDPAAEAKNYQDRLLPRALNRWEKSMPAKILDGFIARFRSYASVSEPDPNDYPDFPVWHYPDSPDTCPCVTCSTSRLWNGV